MYGRGTRLLTQPTQSTAPGVGPGAYRLDNGKHKGESYAPFRSMAARKSFLTVDSELAAAPGPAHYTPTLESHVKGGDSLHSRARRFDDLRLRAPGPGTYSISKKSDWLRKTYPPSSERDEVVLSADVFRSGRLLFTRKPTAPSIPTPGKSCGYDETGDGNLTPQQLPAHDSTMGPAYYDVSHEPTTTTVKYKGVHFGNLQALRTQFKGREGPGPGDYHQSTSEDEDDLPHHTTQSQSLPRYHILITRQEEKKAVPGPGKYEIQSQFKPGQSVDGAGQTDDDNDDEEDCDDNQSRAPFGSSQQRFVSPKYHSPACTAYQDPRSAFCMSGGGRGGGGRAPFGQTSMRFRSNRLAREIPGPGTYNNNQMTSLVADLSKKSQYHGTFKCPFGSTAVRTAPLIKRDEMLFPGPAHYQQRPSSGIRETVDLEKKRGEQKVQSERPSYTFSSTTSRLYSPPSIVTDIPPPGSYEVSESYAKSQADRGQSSVGRRSVRGAFLSSSLRSAPPRDIMLEEPDSDNPGPGEYECKGTLGKGKPGLLCQRDERFKPIDSRVPGPGAYTLSKTYKDTVLHGTYNATLNNPLTTTDQKSPKKTTKKHSLILEA